MERGREWTGFAACTSQGLLGTRRLPHRKYPKPQNHFRKSKVHAYSPVREAPQHQVIQIALIALHVVVIKVGVAFAPPPSEQSHIRVTLGFGENLAASLGGDTPGVALWDDLGEAIRQAFGSGQEIPQDGFAAVKVNASNIVGNVPSTYMSVTDGGDNAVCVQAYCWPLQTEEGVASQVVY